MRQQAKVRQAVGEWFTLIVARVTGIGGSVANCVPAGHEYISQLRMEALEGGGGRVGGRCGKAVGARRRLSVRSSRGVAVVTRYIYCGCHVRNWWAG